MGSGQRLYYIAAQKREGQRDCAGFQMATVRPRVLAMPDRQEGRTGKIIEFDPKLVEEDVITKVLDFY